MFAPFFLYSGDFRPRHLKALNESALGGVRRYTRPCSCRAGRCRLCFQFFIDSRHMDAEVDRNVAGRPPAAYSVSIFSRSPNVKYPVISHVPHLSFCAFQLNNASGGFRFLSHLILSFPIHQGNRMYQSAGKTGQVPDCQPCKTGHRSERYQGKGGLHG